jgi:hypothetical protein
MLTNQDHPITPMEYVEDADLIVDRALSPEQGSIPPNLTDVVRAALRYQRDMRRAQSELRSAQAQLRQHRLDATLVHGHPLVEGRSDGGPRHYLAGDPVRAGTFLYLLTAGGWVPGRYEWSYVAGDPPTFIFELPGGSPNGVDASVRVRHGARLAWPSEIDG